MKKMPKPEFQLGEEVWVIFKGTREYLAKGIISGIEIKTTKIEYKLQYQFSQSFSLYRLNNKKDAIKEMKWLVSRHIEELKHEIELENAMLKELDTLPENNNTSNFFVEDDDE
jgi:hypothetical protein